MGIGHHEVSNQYVVPDGLKTKEEIDRFYQMVGNKIKQHEALEKEDERKKKIDYINSLINKINIDLPGIEDVNNLKEAWNGDAKLSFYKDNDLPKLTGKYYYENLFYLKSIDDNDDHSILYSDYMGHILSDDITKIDKLHNFNRYSRSFLIKPVLDFRDCPELFELLNFPRCDASGRELKYSEVMFGYYPTNVPTKSQICKLNDMLKNKSLKLLDDEYTFDGTYAHGKNSYKKDFTPLKYPVYELDGKKYIHWKVNQCPDSRDFFDKLFRSENYFTLNLSHSLDYGNGEYTWVEVSEINWIVDIRRKKLISANNILSGIQFENYSKTRGSIDYLNSNIKYFLVNYLKKELLRDAYLYFIDKQINKTVTKVDIQEEETTKVHCNSEIAKLLNDINYYKQYYYGNIDISSKVKELLTEYNDALDKAKKSINKEELSLPIGYKTPSYLHRELINKLNDIIADMRLYCEKIRNYHHMKTILNECSKDVVNPQVDPICEIIYQCKSLIIPTIINKEVQKELLDELNIIIKGNIEYNSGFIEEFKNTGNVTVISLEKLQEKFQGDIKDFLTKLDNIIRSQDVVSEILNNIRIKIRDYHVETQKKNLASIQNIIDQSIEAISKTGNEEDKENVEKIINEAEAELSSTPSDENSLNLKDDYHTTVKKLISRCARIIKIQLDIEERTRQMAEIDDLRVDVNYLNSLTSGQETFQK